MSVIATSCPKPVVKFPLLWPTKTWQFDFQESNQASQFRIRTQNSEFRFEKQELRIESQYIDSLNWAGIKIKNWKLMEISFFRKTTQRLDWEREIGICGDNAPAKGVITQKISFNEPSVRKERKTLVFGWSAVDGEKKHLLGGQLSETETSKRGNMSEVLRRNPSNKTSEIRRTFVFRTSTPARAAVTSENKHSICDIFSKYFLLKLLHNLYILPKLFIIMLCWVALYMLLSVLCHFQQVTYMWRIIRWCQWMLASRVCDAAIYIFVSK